VARRQPAEYLELGREGILHLLRIEHAAPWLEIEAKIADQMYPPIGSRVEPHHLSAARRTLEYEARLVVTEGTTRGGSNVPVFHLPGASGRRFDDASARKRILTARYYGWARGTKSRMGRIGPAGEAALHTALREAAGAGYRLISPGRQVDRLLGVPMVGPLDAAAHFLPTDDEGRPGEAITIPIEVKNLRDWIYPVSRELYQLLSKAAVIQEANPDRLVAPVLLCRKAHITTMRMAKALGFFIIPIERQYIQHVDEEALVEIRTELGMLDLVQQKGPDERLVKFFTTHLPKVVQRTADDWQTFGPAMGDTWSELNAESDTGRRAALVHRIRTEFKEITGDYPAGW
jgi:hypothetical protein